jgi:hypothetical protein
VSNLNSSTQAIARAGEDCMQDVGRTLYRLHHLGVTIMSLEFMEGLYSLFENFIDGLNSITGSESDGELIFNKAGPDLLFVFLNGLLQK